jgi:hypothetical protein
MTLAMTDLLNKLVALNAAQIVADAAQAQLTRSKHRLSGDDTDLSNTWEEICVQVQGERNYFGEAYDCAMRDAVLGALIFLDRNVRESLWLHTDDGEHLRSELEIAEEDGLTSQADYVRPDIPTDDDAIARHIIANHVLPLALNYMNSRIERFLCPADIDADDTDEELNSNTEIEKEQLPPSLPPYPTEVPPEVMNPALPPLPKPIRKDDFPDVAEYLRGCEGRGTAAIHLVLCEDTYESSFGDGVFHYAEVAYFDLSAAKKHQGEDQDDRMQAGLYNYHIRPGVIWLDGDTIGYEVPCRMFDRFSGEEVLRLVSKLIQKDRSISVPERRT